ncbi:probable U5 snRNP 100 kD protein [Serendipita indica DSM 11827]|uniref:RNA helicase n=1 Tax=Serendipita indica (strain DSM 11827) TaxID=1109443 RepID=G4TNA7_SERID|nr:probable U5 snRNP 100 kD protein [Serendipita indica DSM 11827]
MSRTPLSIETLLQKQKEEKEAASKPKFLTKEERAALAIERRKKEIQEEKEKAERLKAQREALESSAALASDDTRNEAEDFRANSRARERDRRDYDGRGSRNDDRRKDPRDDRSSRPLPTGPRADRSKNPPNFTRSGDMGPPPVPSKAGPSTGDASADDGTNMTSSELDAIRSRYLGVDKKKKPVRKMTDRKFVFAWSAQDDTFAMDSPAAIGSQRQGAAVMFGRGHLAGMENTYTPSYPLPGRDGQDSSTTLDLTPAGRRKAPVDERHWSEKPLSEMKDRDWRILKADFSISARGGNIPYPLRSWDESSIPPQILDVIARIGYEQPTPIQRQAIPIGLQNRDLIGIAETGSGKTAAFVIPMLTYIGQLPPLTDENRHLGPYALILAPTRELAQQIEAETKKLASPLGYKCVSIVGGRAVEEQAYNLREGAEIIIATPGRLKDVIDRHVVVLSQCTYVVMDEADRMVHLGFEADLTFILDALPTDLLKGENAMEVDGMTANSKARTRVTTLFSATMPPAVERLARQYLKKAATIAIGEVGRAVETVEQRVEFVGSEEKKKQRLIDILNNEGFPPPSLSSSTRKRRLIWSPKISNELAASTLHSGKSQEQREAALQQLRNGEVDVLVATDLAGRGIDVPNVSLVINFQMSNTIEAYIHRIGRTGRAGKNGVAITFLTNDDDEVMYDLKQEIKKSPISKVPPELERHEAAQQKITKEMKRKRDEDQG